MSDEEKLNTVQSELEELLPTSEPQDSYEEVIVKLEQKQVKRTNWKAYGLKYNNLCKLLLAEAGKDNLSELDTLSLIESGEIINILKAKLQKDIISQYIEEIKKYVEVDDTIDFNNLIDKLVNFAFNKGRDMTISSAKEVRWIDGGKEEYLKQIVCL
jgi:hypothetical protein